MVACHCQDYLNCKLRFYRKLVRNPTYSFFFHSLNKTYCAKNLPSFVGASVTGCCDLLIIQLASMPPSNPATGQPDMLLPKQDAHKTRKSNPVVFQDLKFGLRKVPVLIR